MCRSVLLSAAAIVLTAAHTSPANAHGYAGSRFFPATIATEDPAAADELALPTITHSGDETEYSGEFAKRITPHLAFSVGQAWTHEDGGGEGLQNLETGLKWQFLTDPEAEAMMSLGLDVEWGGTGDAEAGAEDTTVIAPGILFGKGFGGAASEVLRPFAITGQISYAVPTHARDDAGDSIPNVLSGGFALEYSLPYLNSHVRDHGWPSWVNHLTPLVEVSFERPLGHNAGNMTGTVNPGVLWSGRRVQLGAELVIPMNDESGDTTGWALQAHFFIDDMFPRTLGRPLIGGAP